MKKFLLKLLFLGCLFGVFCANDALATTYPASTTGTVGVILSIPVQTATGSGNYVVSSGTLPAGLSINATSGLISGTPTTPVVASIQVKRGTGTASVAFSITISAIGIPTVTGGGTFCANSATLTASSVTPTGGTYKWYTVASGGTAISGANSITYTATASGTYYASYTPPTGTIEGGRSTSGAAVILNATISTTPTGLTYSYPFTGNANDVGGSANNGILQGATLPVLTADRFGTASSAYNLTANTNAATNYITTTTSITAPAEFTISIWFNTTTTTGGKLIGFGSVKTGNSVVMDRHIYMSNDGTVNFGIYNGATDTIHSAGKYNDGFWHHAVATVSATLGSVLYIDDIEVSADPTMTIPQGNTGWWRIGGDNLNGWPSRPTSDYFIGKLDDIQIYNTVLTAAQVTNLNGNVTNAGNEAPICVGSTLNLTANTVSGATGYSWTGPNGFTSTSQNPSILNATVAASGNYKVTVTTAVGCSSSAVTVATVSALPVASFTTSVASVAVNTNVTITNTSTGGLTYAWNFDSGATPATSTSTATTQTVTWSTPGTKTITLTVTNAAGCTATTTQTVVVSLPTSLSNNYTLTMPLTVNSTTLTSTDLSNFPLLLSISDPSLKTVVTGCNGAVVKFPGPTSYDFAFYDPTTGIEAPYQVVNYDQTAGTLLVWVKVGTLQSATNNTLYFLYGATAANTANTPANVWDTNYQAVYNFDETAYSTTTGAVLDRKGTYNATVGNMVTGDLVSGKIGNAYNFGGTKKITSTTVTNINSSYTLSAWVKTSSLTADQKIVTNQKSTSTIFGPFVDGYKLGITNPALNSTTPLYAEVESRDMSNFPFNPTTYSSRGATGGTNLATTGSWHHIEGVYNNSTGNFTCYVDGATAERVAGGIAPGTSYDGPIIIGQDYDGGAEFNGIIDEVRISTVARTAAWAKAEYQNQNTVGVGWATQGALSGGAAAITTPGVTTYTWTGASSADPSIAGNWSSSPIVSSNLPNFTGKYANLDITTAGTQPALSTDISLYGLTIEAGASLNLNGHTIVVGCNIINSSTIGGNILYNNNTSSTITWNGSIAQTYTGSSTSKLETGNMNVGTASLTLTGGPVNIYSVLAITGTNVLTITSPAVLTLKSTATTTASVDKITATSITGTGSGNINVERYMSGVISGRRGYRLLSSPVYTSALGATNGYTLQALQKTTPVTGWGTAGLPFSGLTPPATAFDNSPLGNPSVFFYYEPDKDPVNRQIANSDYKAINAITDALPVGNGFLFFFRGSRSITTNPNMFLTTGTPDNTTLNNTGSLNAGDVKVYIPTLTPVDVVGGHTVYTQTRAAATLSTAFIKTTTTTPNTDGLHLVGNPYACTIDLEVALNSTNFTAQPTGNNYVYGLNNTGAFGAYLLTSFGATSVGGITRWVSSGQGFFIKSSGSSTLTFHEASKVTSGYTSPTSFAVAQNNNAPSQVLHINLMLDSANANETVVQFGYHHASNKFFANEDAAYTTGPLQATYLTSYSSDNKPCLINQMSTLDSVNSITLYAGGPKSGRYTLTFSGAETLDSRYKIYLKDSFKKDSLDLSANTTYQFDLDLTNPKTFGDTRFSLVVHPTHIEDLYQLTTFDAIKYNNSVQLNWKAAHEGYYTDFKVQRSIDGGKTFTTIGNVQSDGSGTYGFADTNPALSGANQYRIFQTVDSTVTKTSSIVTVTYATAVEVVATNILKVYPNPATTTLNVVIKTNEAGGALLMRIYNMKSQLVLSNTFNKDSTLSMDVSKLITGTYVIHVTDNNKDYGSVTFTKL